MPESVENVHYEKYAEMNDDEVALLFQKGDGDALEYLLDKYKNFVRARARSYYLVGADHEDIVQEGMIGLYKAIRDFNPEKQASFHAFTELCVKRQIITAIKTATRQKHVPLNNYVSLNKPLYGDESDRTLLDVIEGRVTILKRCSSVRRIWRISRKSFPHHFPILKERCSMLSCRGKATRRSPRSSAAILNL